MQKQANAGIYSNALTDTALAASRQLWLAGLGAAAYTREWAKNEAGKNFRALVREGSAVESQAVRMLDKRIERSVATANVLWKHARATAMSAAAKVADNATAAFSRVKAPVKVRSTPTKARKTVKAAPKRAARTTRRVKRGSRKS
jgi:hypothetical protein